MFTSFYVKVLPSSLTEDRFTKALTGWVCWGSSTSVVLTTAYHIWILNGHNLPPESLFKYIDSAVKTFIYQHGIYQQVFILINYMLTYWESAIWEFLPFQKYVVNTTIIASLQQSYSKPSCMTAQARLTAFREDLQKNAQHSTEVGSLGATVPNKMMFTHAWEKQSS